MRTSYSVAGKNCFDPAGRTAEPRFINSQDEIADLAVSIAESGRVEIWRQKMVDEALARPFVVNQLLVQVGLFEADGVVDAGHGAAIVLMSGGVADGFVVGFGPSVKCAEKIHSRSANVELIEMAAAARRQERDQAVAGEPDLFASVEIEVVGVDLHPSRGTSARRFNERVGGNQVVVDGVTQMRQVKSAESAVPI
jgi:hypothetical protein